MSEDNKNIEQEEIKAEDTVVETPAEEVAEVESAEENPVTEEEIIAEATEEVAEEVEESASEEETLTHVFSGDVEGEVYTFDQLDTPSDEYTADEYNQLMGMYENTLNTIEEKEIVTGRIYLSTRNMS